MWDKVHTPCEGARWAGRPILGSSASQAIRGQGAQGQAHETPPRARRKKTILTHQGGMFCGNPSGHETRWFPDAAAANQEGQRRKDKTEHQYLSAMDPGASCGYITDKPASPETSWQHNRWGNLPWSFSSCPLSFSSLTGMCQFVLR